MPDDNSCMFTAFGGVLQRADPAPTLRREVAEYILAHPEKFDKVVLEMDPQQYARTIQSPDRWGGAIELSILSDIYDIEICSVDVKVGWFLPFSRYGSKLTRGKSHNVSTDTARAKRPAAFSSTRASTTTASPSPWTSACPWTLTR